MLADLNLANLADVPYAARVAGALLDQNDAFILEFARKAEQEGALLVAGFLLSSRADLSDFREFLQRNGNVEGFVPHPLFMADYGFLLLRDAERKDGLMPSIHFRSYDQYQNNMHVRGVTAMGLDAGTLTILLNQTREKN